jgi:CHAT domain-containing protein
MEASLAAFQELLRAARAQHDRRVEASTINFIGLWHQTMGEYAEARRHYEEALPLARAVGDRETEGVALYHIAWLRFVEHDYRSAITWYERSLAVRRAIGDRHGEAATLAGLGMAYNSLADWPRAIEIEQQALLIADDRRLQADILDHTGRAELGRGRAAEAETLHRRALTIRREIGDRGGQTFSLSALAHAQRAQGNVDGAIASMEDVVAIIEASREAVASSRLRQTMFATRQGHYLHLVDVLMDAHREREALDVSERARARVTLDEIREQGGLPPDSWPPLVEALDDETALLEYAEGEKRSFVWLMTTTSLESHVLAPRAEIDAAARRLHALLASREQRRVEHDLLQATAALSRMVLPPLSLPPRIKRIVVVADGALQFIPFAMLSPRRGRPLLADYEVTAAPSASVVALMRKLNGTRGGGAGVAVVADPVFRADDPRVGGKGAPNGDAFRSANDVGLKNLERLPYTRGEADAIVRLARGATLRAVDFDASRGTVTSAPFGQYAVIHFATHALLNTKHPELSGIVLSLVDRRGRPLDGFLSVTDIYALRLRGSLVVLSACRTALGKEVRGEGLVGLVRAFMYAGAPSVVASYWDVGDADTAEVMKRFYRRLLSGHEKPSAALRNAQLSIAKERGWRSPRTWAAFTLQGDWSR